MIADKRWTRRRQAWVTPPEAFRPHLYSVDVIEERAAKTFICEHHYAGTFPAARMSVGLYGPGAALVGVAVFSVPMQQAVIPKYTGFPSIEGAELGRFVCLPSVQFNGESWFLARAFRLLAEEKATRGVVSYADPLERRTPAGELTKRQHWGTIYQASNALFAGRSSRETLLTAPDGSVVSRRALSKIRNGESGREYSTRQLIAKGAPIRQFGESPADWIARVQRSPGFKTIRHPGNLVYVFGLDRFATKRIAELHDGGLEYEKREVA